MIWKIATDKSRKTTKTKRTAKKMTIGEKRMRKILKSI